MRGRLHRDSDRSRLLPPPLLPPTDLEELNIHHDHQARSSITTQQPPSTTTPNVTAGPKHGEVHLQRCAEVKECSRQYHAVRRQSMSSTLFSIAEQQSVWVQGRITEDRLVR